MFFSDIYPALNKFKILLEKLIFELNNSNIFHIQTQKFKYFFIPNFFIYSSSKSLANIKFTHSNPKKINKHKFHKLSMEEHERYHCYMLMKYMLMVQSRQVVNEHSWYRQVEYQQSKQVGQQPSWNRHKELSMMKLQLVQSMLIQQLVLCKLNFLV